MGEPSHTQGGDLVSTGAEVSHDAP